LKCISGNYSIAGNRGHLACFRRYLIELELELELRDEIRPGFTVFDCVSLILC